MDCFSRQEDEFKRRKLNGWTLEDTDDCVHHVNKLRADMARASETNGVTEMDTKGEEKLENGQAESASSVDIEKTSQDQKGGQTGSGSQEQDAQKEKDSTVQESKVESEKKLEAKESKESEKDAKLNLEGEKMPFSVDPKSFRQYDLACERVKGFYQEQHQKQTVAYNLQARINFKSKTRAKMSIWEGLEKLNKLLDDSDPDTQLSQIDHALQTAEAIRRDGQPRWMQLVGLIHDLGKLLYFFDSQGQWDVVGDTFPVGCRFSRRIIFSEAFSSNPDYGNPLYNTKFGIYTKHCGLASVMLSWGHDEYMYHVAKSSSTLPDEALAMIRYHSFYPWHQENAYTYLMDEKDHEALKWVRLFNKFDLYSKADDRYNVEELKPYYLALIDEYFPEKIVEF